MEHETKHETKKENRNTLKKVIIFALILICLLIWLFTSLFDSTRNHSVVSTTHSKQSIHKVVHSKTSLSKTTTKTSTTSTAGEGVNWSTQELEHPSNVLDFNAYPLRQILLNGRVLSYFYLTAQRGQVLTEKIRITNANPYSITVHLLPVQAETGTNGGIVYQNGISQDTWLTGLPTQVTIGPKSTGVASFGIDIPPNATSFFLLNNESCTEGLISRHACC